MRKSLIIGLVAVLIIVIVGGYFAWTYYQSLNQKKNNPPLIPSMDQLRDQTMVYIEANHTDTVQLAQSLSWTGGRQETGLLGSEIYLYTSGNWSLGIQYPVVPNPIYTITANYSSADASIQWAGYYQNGNFTETSYNEGKAPVVTLSTQEQVRDITVAYLGAYHNQTQQYMQSFSWTGGRITPEGLVGSETYSYQSTGWNVTMQYPVVPNTIYCVNATYTLSGKAVVSWQGTIQSGTIAETVYKYNL